MASVKKNDTVIVMQGKEKKKIGKIVSIEKNRVRVQGVNMVKKAVKPKSQQDKGGIISVEAPLHISNVMIFSKGKRSRIGTKIIDGKKVRIAKKTGETL